MCRKRKTMNYSANKTIIMAAYKFICVDEECLSKEKQ
jgi:hypothetical protein